MRPSAYPRATVASVEGRAARKRRSVANTLPLVNATELQDAAGNTATSGKHWDFPAADYRRKREAGPDEIERIVLAEHAHRPMRQDSQVPQAAWREPSRNRAELLGVHCRSGFSAQARWLISRTRLMPPSRRCAASPERIVNSLGRQAQTIHARVEMNAGIEPCMTRAAAVRPDRDFVERIEHRSQSMGLELLRCVSGQHAIEHEYPGSRHDRPEPRCPPPVARQSRCRIRPPRVRVRPVLRRARRHRP